MADVWQEVQETQHDLGAFQADNPEMALRMALAALQQRKNPSGRIQTMERLRKADSSVETLLPLILAAAQTQEPGASEASLAQILRELLTFPRPGESERPSPAQIEALLGGVPGPAPLSGGRQGASGGDAIRALLEGLQGPGRFRITR